ncbi:M23 family metallopeptidase [Desulfovibrio aminophilus]|nr:M23 family metallopeptidase [Desulfovibrio aminophilus]MCM0755884.1 M23 family metallopeptidase [Desulfovibrio aminophilus]
MNRLPLLRIFLLLLVVSLRPDILLALRFDSLPIDCTGNELCFIQNYFDREPGSFARDHACGFLSYDGHEGTDFRVARADMERGVPVLAVADGVVRAVRDGMSDGEMLRRGKAGLRGREAGNAVAVAHGDGFETQYSHLRQGSVRVKPGEHVRAGQVLGLVGESGMAEFPHVEFLVRRGRTAFCPFVGPDAGPGCGVKGSPLWSEERLTVAPLAYKPTGLLRAGFVAKAPGSINHFLDKALLPARGGDPEALLFCVAVFGTRTGDAVTMRLLGPDGAVLAREARNCERTQAQSMFYIGRKRNNQWPAGTYRGEFLLQRPGDPGEGGTLRLSREIVLP